MKASSKGATAPSKKPIRSLAAVTPLKQFAAPLDARSSAYVDDLTELLRLARCGKLSGFVWIGSRIEDDDESYVFYSDRSTQPEDPISVLGLLEVMKRDLLQGIGR